MFKRIYRLFACLGVMAVPAAFLVGFGYDASAPVSNYGFNIGIYVAFILVHYVMTMPAFKKMFVGRPEGSPGERRLYITISIVTWIAVFAFHKSVPGFYIEPIFWLQFVGFCAVLLGVFAFFEFANFDALDSLFGVPGAEVSHTAAAETPLLTEGSYGKVRHPMYRAAVFLYLSSLLIHPHAGQLLFAAMVVISFVGFIPLEEAQLLKARGDDYREYRRKVPYRVFPGIW